MKVKIVNLITSVRTLMRSEFCPSFPLANWRSVGCGFVVWYVLMMGGWLSVPLIVINTFVIVYEVLLG